MVWLLPVQKQPLTRIDKKNDCYACYRILREPLSPVQARRRLTSCRDCHGAFEVRLLEMPSVNSPEEASLWVELYDLDLRLGVDSYKCSHLDEAIDAAHLLMIKAKLLNNEAEEAAPFSYEGLQENL